MRTYDYRTLKKANQKINFIWVSLVKTLNWGSETGRTTANKIFFLLIFSNVFVGKRKRSKESDLNDLNYPRKNLKKV